MIASRRNRKSTDYFDSFWGCPTCHRSLSIAEVIELHCEYCNAAVEPTEMADTQPTAEASSFERLP
ncbi:hypothetical protein BSK43_018180 [Rhizobium sp. P44RR-XXIV]|nr:hypothetical protein BSK43_018180 [Rhizobium sp. P44RR-XXIV]